MRYQLRNKNYNDENVELALYNLLKDRGIEEPVKWLYPTEECEYSPFEISNIKKAIQILNKIIKKIYYCNGKNFFYYIFYSPYNK